MATGALEAPIAVGSLPRGLDLSEDGRTLYVVDSGAYEVSVVDLALRREVRRITIPQVDYYPRQPTTIAVARNGTALLGTTPLPLARALILDLATGSVSSGTEAPRIFYADGVRLKASEDHSRIVFSNLGQLVAYDVASATFGAVQPMPTISPFFAVGGGGSTILAGPQTTRFDGDLVPRATIPDGGKGLAVDAAGTKGYRVQESSIDVLDLARGLPVASIALPQAVGSGRAMSPWPRAGPSWPC